MRRGYAIAIVFTVFLILGLLVVVFTIPTLVSQAVAILENEPAIRVRLADYLAGSHLTAPLATWLRDLKADALKGAIIAAAFDFSLRVFSVIAYGLSALFLGLYIIIDRDRLRGGLFALVPRSHHIRLSRIMMNLETIVVAYIRGQIVPRIYGRALRLPSSIVLFAFLAGGTLMGILGALLALPVAATVMMLIQELRVELPGEQMQLSDTRLREADDRGEKEYERGTEGVGAEQAAAIATEISRDRREEENHPPEAVGRAIDSGNANGHETSTPLTKTREGKP